MDKGPTTQHSCLHLLYLCEEKTLAEGRLARNGTRILSLSINLTLGNPTGHKMSHIRRFNLSMLRENQTISDEGF